MFNERPEGLLTLSNIVPANVLRAGRRVCLEIFGELAGAVNRGRKLGNQCPWVSRTVGDGPRLGRMRGNAPESNRAKRKGNGNGSANGTERKEVGHGMGFLG